MTSKKMFSYVLRLTSNFTDRFLTFSDSSFQIKCTILFKTCNVGIPSQCKIIQLFKLVAFLFSVQYIITDHNSGESAHTPMSYCPASQE